MDMQALRDAALKELEIVESSDALELWRVAYLGRKSVLQSALRSLGKTTLEEKKNRGPLFHTTKKTLEEAYMQKQKDLEKKDTNNFHVDLTRTGIRPARGHLHPLSLVENDIRRIFNAMNFSVIEGPELETEHYNFDALNIPKNHPARDMQDTLWVNSQKGLLMRTQTSPMQIRYMQKNLPPFQIIMPGRVFRHEATDASHETNFYQCEGLMVGPNVSLANFKYIIGEFFKQFFMQPVAVRFRPSYFPFVEPSIEVDIKLLKFNDQHPESSWLEVMGAGMVHPKVFEAVHYDSKKVQGFAFGCGMDRLAMLKYDIPDIRLFYGGDMRFINQF